MLDWWLPGGRWSMQRAQPGFLSSAAQPATPPRCCRCRCCCRCRRRSLKGTRFLVSNATLFNVEAPTGQVVGQAVKIREWEFEDGTKVCVERGLTVCVCV